MIVVTGATGNVGRPLVQTLTAVGEEVTAISRHPSPRGAIATALRRRADLNDPTSLRPVLDGAEALFLLVAGENPTGILEVAKESGVHRVVLLSSLGARTRPESYLHLRKHEEAVRLSGLDWTVLRPGGFHSNTLMWAELIRSRRMVTAPFGDIGLPGIDPADIAEVAAVVLREKSHAGSTYELTGPTLSSPRQQAGAIGEALKTPITFVEQSREEAKAQMLRYMPEPVVNATLAILGDPLAAERRVSPDVERILGRAPGGFDAWATRNIAAFR